jgi:hypothetical protein
MIIAFTTIKYDSEKGVQELDKRHVEGKKYVTEANDVIHFLCHVLNVVNKILIKVACVKTSDFLIKIIIQLKKMYLQNRKLVTFFLQSSK